MILRIDEVTSTGSEVFCVPYSWLQNKAVHLFLACNKWEKLEVVMSEDIPDNVLKFIILKCDEKEVFMPSGQPSKRIVNLVCEMFPEKAGSIRKAAMLGRNIKNVLS